MRRSVTKQVVLAAGFCLTLSAVCGAMRRTGPPLAGERNAPLPAELATSARAVVARERQATTARAERLHRVDAGERNAPIASIPDLASGTAAEEHRGRTRTLTDRVPRKE